jgi:ketose-bisphosphate aldolase
MHIAPYDNQNKPIVDAENACVPLNYFNIVKLKKGEAFEYQVPGYETCIVPATGSVDVNVEGVAFAKLGNRGVDVWDGEPEGVYVPVGAKVTIVCVSDQTETFIAGAKYDKVLEPFDVRADGLDLVQYGSDDTKTHRKIKHILGQKHHDKVGRLLVSELFTVGQGGWSGFPSHKHDTDRLPDETRHDETYNFRFRPNHGSGVQMLQREDNKPGDAYHIVDGSTICLDKGYHPCCGAAGLRDVLFHHPWRAQPALADPVFPAHPCLPDRDDPGHQGHGRQVQMSIATLAEVLQPALKQGYAVAGLVTLGWEDMRAYVAAGEAEGLPVILQAGPSCRAHTPLPILGKMFRHLAENASVPVVAHLDHGYTFEECREALDSGFTSLMFDGSRKPLAQNIEETARIAEMAHEAGISCEGEIGFVGYSGGESVGRHRSTGSGPLCQRNRVDAMAISVGNVHLQQDREGGLDEPRIRAIEALTEVPLVIHGGSGVPVAQRTALARGSRICKFNIGTELRMAFGEALRGAVNRDPERFDRVTILKETHDPVMAAARQVIRAFGPGQA